MNIQLNILKNQANDTNYNDRINFLKDILIFYKDVIK